MSMALLQSAHRSSTEAGRPVIAHACDWSSGNSRQQNRGTNDPHAAAQSLPIQRLVGGLTAKPTEIDNAPPLRCFRIEKTLSATHGQYRNVIWYDFPPTCSRQQDL